ncbi:CoA:oxalate CoA-transferase [Halopenitus malekzadehii]|uniref:CoA:oxalate CoA-transferase n=1 Tax=Halopenitus malekzadehii TaxID=1267564 RepID=A0A1H6JWY4_9EURY|nr:CoA transferase [Halopenitus malekzadehii]SEH63565.1 CoA:oxalate CoA-transferase [Halopenitus malekzadehii]
MVGEARTPSGSDGPLSGVTVLDASRVLVGPFCTMQLGDLGAEVIKIERPGEGDQTRGWHPPSFGGDEDDPGESAYYASVNRNKRSVELNLSTEAGQAVFRDLAREADVVVENFRVGTMDGWDLGYEDLHEGNPGLIYCGISGYGEWGPDRDKPAYDIMMQARGGLMSITGVEGGAPVRVGVALADIGAGMYATQAILAALLDRELGEGEAGQKIDVSLLDGQAAWMSYMATNYFASGESPRRMGSKHPNIVPYRAFETADGYVVVACSSDTFWPPLCAALDRPDLLADDRFETNAKRVQHREALDAELEATFAELTTETALDALAEHDVPASHVRDMAEVFADPQLESRGMRVEMEHPTAGTVEMPGSPMHFSRSPTTYRRHPPLLGEHTTAVLREHGYEDDDIDRLREAGAIPADGGTNGSAANASTTDAD